ncbi:MAG: hypothetical protein ACLR13_04125 [Acutalibacteraceae bacterium]
MKQQVLSCIETRRSVRSYEAKQIPDDGGRDIKSGCLCTKRK